MKFAFIGAELAADRPLDVACEVLGVSRSGYYARLGRPGGRPASGRAAGGRATRREELAAQIADVHRENRGVYGSPRVHRVLEAQGVGACENTVADVMRERESRAKTKRKFVPRTTDRAHGQPAVGNVPDREFKADLPNQKWVVDVTDIPTGEGRLYLAGVMDLCSRKIVGWSMADHMETGPASDAPAMAIAGRRPGEGLLHHGDRGGQYASDDYVHLLRTHGMEASMSGVGRCWDNAVKESFWATLKTEPVHHERYATRDQARASIFEYVEVFYNRKRLHSSLGYVSPAQFEAGLD